MKLAFYPRERDLKDFKQRELIRVWINPFNDNVENMRLAVAKLELRRSTGGYCDRKGLSVSDPATSSFNSPFFISSPYLHSLLWVNSLPSRFA